jgi:uncharacterized YigZ family protein
VTRETYRTLAGRGRSALEIRGSEFLGHAAPAPDVDRAEAVVASVEAEYDDATHNVPAYRVRAGDATVGGGLLREYSSDDGEPSGSAGKPTLNVLQGRDVENAVVVVTRYYGGTNLGVGGLVSAYSRAATAAVEDAAVVDEEPHEPVSVDVAYDDSGTVRGILESSGCEFDASYEDRVTFEARVPVADAEALRDRLLSATSGRADVK